MKRWIDRQQVFLYMKSGLKAKRRRKKSGKSREKTFFLFRRFYLQGCNATNKSCLFYAKFFEFEEFSIVPFFYSSIQPKHAVVQVKLRFSKKATKFETISHMMHLVNFKSSGRLFQNFAAFSECPNFKT